MENNNSCHELYKIIYKGKEPLVCNFQCPFSSPPKYCYTTKTPLIFLDTFKNFIKEENKNKYKIVLITESPYNFPGCPITNCPVKCMKTSGYFKRRDYCEYWAENENEFIKGHLLSYGLKRFFKYDFKIPIDVNSMPYDIFDFIFYTFFPIFKNGENNKENWGNIFIKKIYWTHVAKRSLKGLNKRKAIKQCIPLLKEELEAIQPNLIIVATGWFWKVQGIKFSKVEKEQNNKNGKFLSIEEVINVINKKRAKNKKTIDLLSQFQERKDRYVIVFPNPSPGDRYKADFYKKEYVPKLIKKIHEEIERNYDRLPDC